MIIGDILNKVDQKVKNRATPTSLKKQELKMDDVVHMQVDPKSDLSFEENEFWRIYVFT